MFFTGCSAVVQKLNLSRNGLTPAHIPELQPLLRQFTALTEIDVSYNPLDAALPDLAQFINPECPLVTFRADAFSSDNSESDKTKYQALSSESVCKCLLSLISFRTLAQVSFVSQSIHHPSVSVCALISCCAGKEFLRYLFGRRQKPCLGQLSPGHAS